MFRQFLIMSHGNMSTGLESTISMLLGNNFNLDTVAAYLDGKRTDISSKIEEYLSKLGDDDELIIFTDIFGGSVNNESMKYINDRRVRLISGVNVPLILEILSNSSNKDLSIDTIIREAISEAKEAIVFCNDLDFNLSNDDF
ncbi:PTS sugar transporter subunit IIA [Brachyspira sp.]|uniref:PTS sugar transporter subunit IIA n=1 Tax=Brachyspira sp. TaxID=1977261 RepID=UPI0026254CEF|nr:PTS sugar transporter subunit IIA [Brachyspira sp.]